MQTFPVYVNEMSIRPLYMEVLQEGAAAGISTICFLWNLPILISLAPLGEFVLRSEFEAS